MNIPIAKPDLKSEDIRLVSEVIESGWVVQGPKVKEFESLWCQFTGAKHSIAVSSCTTALHLALIAAGIKKGDKVLVPSFTWIATANAVEYTGATPVFCDIDLNTLNIDTGQVKKHISKGIKAIIPVHLFGLPADINSIKKAASKNNVIIIEDAACGFGSYINGAHVGSKSNFACFSFHPRKAITTGEGGMIVTNNDAAARKLRSLRDHGASISGKEGAKPYLLPNFEMLGYNYRLTDIQAALGIAQMKRAYSILKSRRRIAEKYNKGLADTGWLSLPIAETGLTHGYQSYVCLYKPEEIRTDNVKRIGKERNKFMQYLFDKGISTRPGTHAIHLLKYYSQKYNIKPENFPNSLIADKCSVAFPIFPSMTDEEINYIIKAIHDYRLCAV
ncbi:MAG: DegT/DnrJ/EryC1/StrS family aminotransferase [Ignavibacteria bacterium]|nr:DegT/DnrJ/EryC1/StrS family aminotransferase [Ignavibacteria bacterium]